MKLCLALNRIEGRWDTDRLGDLLRDDEVLESRPALTAMRFWSTGSSAGTAKVKMLTMTRIGTRTKTRTAGTPTGEEEDEPAGGDDEPTMGTTVVRIGHLHFKVEVPRYKLLVESIRDAGIFDQGEIAQEMKRRLLRHD